MTRYAMVDDTDPSIVYIGDWTVITTPLNPLTPEYNHTVHATTDPNASFSITFQGGSVINAFGTLDKPLSKGVPASIWTRDGGSPTHVSGSGVLTSDVVQNMNDTVSHVELYKSGKFAVGQHTLTCNLTSLTGSSGPTFYFDFFAILTADNIEVENVILNNVDSQWTYLGWVPQNSSSAYLDDVSVPPTAGGTATLGFHGTEITVFGNLNGTVPLNTTLAIYQIDDGPMHTVLAANITRPTSTATATVTDDSGAVITNTPTPTLYQNLELIKVSGLDDFGQNQHSIMISALPNEYPPWALDYVVYGPSHSAVQTTSATSTPTFAPVSRKSSSAGAIAGGVIGGVVALLGLVLAIWFLRKRQRQKEAEMQVHGYRNSATVVGGAGGVGASTAASNTVAGTPVSSKKKKRSSMHKGPIRGDSDRPMMANATNQQPVIDISSANSPPPHGVGVGAHGRTESSDVTTTGPNTAQTAYDYVHPRPVREQDGGVRLASGDSEDEEEVAPAVLPPQYARY